VGNDKACIMNNLAHLIQLLLLLINIQDMFMGTFDKPVVPSEYVTTLCITKTEWVPKNLNCLITGRIVGILNQAVEIKMTGICPHNPGKLCAEPVRNGSIAATNKDCIDNWSGKAVFKLAKPFIFRNRYESCCCFRRCSLP